MCNESLDDAADEEDEEEEVEADLEDVQDELPVIQDTKMPIQFYSRLAREKDEKRESY